MKSLSHLRRHAVAMSALILSGVACQLAVASEASADDTIYIKAFKSACFEPVMSEFHKTQSDAQRGWSVVSPDAHTTLQKVHDVQVENLNEKDSQTLTHASQTFGAQTLFLTRFTNHDKSFDTAMCMVHSYDRDDYTFPAGMDEFLKGNIVENKFSRMVRDGRQSYGNWRTTEVQKPIYLISISASPKDIDDIDNEKMFGLYMSTKTDVGTSTPATASE